MLESLKNITDASTKHNVLTRSKNIAAIKVTGGKDNTTNNNGYTKFSLPKTSNQENLEVLTVGDEDDESDAVETVILVSPLFLCLTHSESYFIRSIFYFELFGIFVNITNLRR